MRWGGEGCLTSVPKPGLCCHLVAILGSAPVRALFIRPEIQSLELSKTEHCSGITADAGWPPKDRVQNSTQRQIPTRTESHAKIPKDAGSLPWRRDQERLIQTASDGEPGP